MSHIPPNLIKAEFGSDDNGNPVTIAQKYLELKQKIIEINIPFFGIFA